MADPKLMPFLNCDLIKANLNFGGIRIEDDVMLTADGIECLTDVPRTVEDVEAFMAARD
jgi:Xaa-Pro dipeptidase